MIRLVAILLIALQALISLACTPAMAMLPKHGIPHGSAKRMSDYAARSSRRTRRHRRNRVARSLRHHFLSHRSGQRHAVAPRCAYRSDFFVWNAPSQVEPHLDQAEAGKAKELFEQGDAEKYSPAQLLEAGVFADEPLVGGIFTRREEVKNIILHSTETVHPADARRIIHSWNRGLRHPGAQYIVDRDGRIYQTVDPEFATVHVDVFRTLKGINNDNSIGIEMVRTGSQQYTKPQLDSVAKLVVYLQSRFGVKDDHIFGHGQIQPSDRQDPVDFDWTAFQAAKSALHTQSVAYQKHVHSAVIVPTRAESGTTPSFAAPAQAPAHPAGTTACAAQPEHIQKFVEAECGISQ